jgi:O-antigen/teichoic acid export membrane protein
MKTGTSIHDFGFTFFSRVICLFTGLATQSSLAWFLGPSDRGSYAVCLIFATFLNVFCLIGCDIASVYFVSSKRFSLSEGVVYAFIYGGLGSLLGVIVGYVLLQFPLSYWEKASISSFYLALGLIPMMVFSYILLQLVTAVHRFGWAAFFSVLQSLFILLFTLLFLWWFHLGVKGALWGLICGYVLVILTVLVFFRKHYGLNWVRHRRDRLKEMFNYGLRYYLGKISNLMNLEIGTMILAFFAPREQVGMFSIASQITSHTMIIPTSLITILIPKVASDTTGRKDLIAQCSRLTFQLMVIAMVVLAIFARPIMTLLFSPEFAPAVILVQIMTIGVVIRSTGKVLVPYMLGTNRPGISSMSVACGAVVNVVVLLVLSPIWGLPGAAVAMVAGFAASTLILLIYFVRMSKIRMVELFVFKPSDWILIYTHLRKIACKGKSAHKIKAG